MDSPVGVIAKAKDVLATTLATCTAFRTFEGNSWTVPQALARVYLDAFPPPGSNAPDYSAAEWAAYMPCALIYKPREDGVRLRFVAVGASGRQFVPSGTLVIELWRKVPDDEVNDPGAADRSFENMAGQLMRSGDPLNPGLWELAGQAGYTAITAIRESGPHRVDPNDLPGRLDCQVYLITVEWGQR